MCIIDRYNNIRIQRDKVNCFSFPKDQKTILLDIYAEAINMNSSEANLLPDIDVISCSFTQKAYNIQNLEMSKKIRDLGLLRNNNYNATRFINALLRLKKNTYVNKKTMSQYFDQIEYSYSCLLYTSILRFCAGFLPVWQCKTNPEYALQVPELCGVKCKQNTNFSLNRKFYIRQH